MSDHERTSTIPDRRPQPDGADGRRVPAHARAHARVRPRLWRRRKRPSASRSASCASCSLLFGLGVLGGRLDRCSGCSWPSRPTCRSSRTPTHTPIGDRRPPRRRDRHADRQRAPDLPLRDADRAGDEARDHRDRGPPLLHQQRRRPARHRPRGRRRTSPPGGAVQGASTIPQQFVKISLAAENDRTSSRSCARPRSPTTSRASGPRSGSCATTSTRSTSATAPTGSSRPRAPTSRYNHDGCGERQGRAAVRVGPAAARGRAAGRRSSPRRARYDPIQHPVARQAPARPRAAAHAPSRATSRARSTTTEKAAGRCPTRDDLTFPKEDTKYPYFTSWIKQQVVDQLGGGQQGAQRAFEGGLQVKTTIDSRLQTRRREGDQRLAAQGRVRPARVAGRDLQQRRRGPRDGRRRQLRRPRRSTSPPRASASPAPRSSRSCSPRRCAAGHQPAVDVGVEEADLHPQGRRERFTVNNYDDAYVGRDDAGATRRPSPTTPSTPRSA